MINTERLCFGCMNDNGGEKICPVCGYDSASKNPEDTLPVKFTVNNRYLVGKVISATGESITYIGWDNIESSVVEIKEYFPKGFARRNPDKTVSMVKGGEYTFNEGLLEFTEINENIMASELPSLIPVMSVFEENGTVYAISAHIIGITLERFLEKNGGLLKWEQARALFLPLIDTVKGMNDLNIIHRGISTENIIVSRDGKLRIANYSIKKLRYDDSELESQLYPGYSPVELYGFENMHDGYYTDVYGLCATLFRVLIGIAPPEALVRLRDDSMTVPAKFAEELPRHVLAALANGLQVLPENRTRNIEQFKNELVYAEISENSPSHITHTQKESAENLKTEKKSSSAKYAVISAACTAMVFLVLAAVLIFTVFKEDVFPDKTESSSSEETSINPPKVESIGTIDSGAEVTAKQYSVPEFRGKYYADISENDEYEMFNLVVTDKAYSDDYPKGTVCSQSVAAKSEVVRDTKIELVISLGPQQIKMPNLIGMEKDAAIVELLKQGFMYEFINSDTEKEYVKYDEDSKPGVVVDQYPEYGTMVSTDIAVEFFINSYTGDENSETSLSGSTNESSSNSFPQQQE